MTLSLVAALLTSGQTVSVRLEPGDGSGYDFVIVPMWTGSVDSRALGYADEDRERGFYIINAAYHDALTARAVIIGSENWHEVARDLGYYGVTKWTARLLAWWFEQELWPRIEVLRASGAAAVREMQHAEQPGPDQREIDDGSLA